MLSGGNQQRVILARALARKPACVIAVQATIGLDAATANYVHALIRGVAKGGGCVLYVSTDLDELIELTDRIAIMYRGRVVGVHDRTRFDIGEIGPSCVPGRVQRGAIAQDPDPAIEERSWLTLARLKEIAGPPRRLGASCWHSSSGRYPIAAAGVNPIDAYATVLKGASEDPTSSP